MPRLSILVLLLALAACDSADDTASIDGPNELRATVNGEALVVPVNEIGWGSQPGVFVQWNGAYCVPDDYPQNLHFQFEVPEVEVGTYSISRDAPADGPNLSLIDSDGDATAGDYRVREGETATVTISGIDRESGYIQGEFSGTFEIVPNGGDPDARYFPDVLEVEDGAFTISVFDEFTTTRSYPCE